MDRPTLKDIRRAASQEGAEPLYTQAFWRGCVRRLLAIIGKEKCTWTQDGDIESELYATSCGQNFHMLDGTPVESKFTHCCYCGGQIEQVLIEPEADGELSGATNIGQQTNAA